jgi:hypothetical protein
MSGNTIFLQPGTLSEVGETVAHILPQAVEIAALKEFKKKYTCMAHILRSIHNSDLNLTERMSLQKTSSINENRLNT